MHPGDPLLEVGIKLYLRNPGMQDLPSPLPALPFQALYSPLTEVKRNLIFSESILASLGLLISLEGQEGVLPNRSKLQL